MKWTHEPIRGTGYNQVMLALTPEEAGMIAEELRPVLKSLKKKYDRLEDIRQNGDATTKQLDKWTILGEKIGTVEQFIDLTDGFY